MKTTTSTTQTNAKINNYLLSVIDGQEHGKTLTTTREKLQFVADTFKSEYGHNIKKRGYVGALAEWFGGLPSAINIEYQNDEIIKLAKEFGSIPENATAIQEDKIINNWFAYLANMLVQLFNKHLVTM